MSHYIPLGYSMVKNRIKLKELNQPKRKVLSQPVSFAFMVTALTSCGGAGNDTLIGGGGSDTLEGRTGSDSIVFLKSDGTSGADTITDFTTQAGDKLDLSSFGISIKSKALDTITDDGSGNTQVTIDGDLIVTFNAISISDLSGYDFIA